MTQWLLFYLLSGAVIGYWCRSERVPMGITLLLSVAFAMLTDAIFR